MRFYRLRAGLPPKLVGLTIGPLKFGVARHIIVVPEHVLQTRWGPIVYLTIAPPRTVGVE